MWLKHSASPVVSFSPLCTYLSCAVYVESTRAFRRFYLMLFHLDVELPRKQMRPKFGFNKYVLRQVVSPLTSDQTRSRHYDVLLRCAFKVSINSKFIRLSLIIDASLQI